MNTKDLFSDLPSDDGKQSRKPKAKKRHFFSKQTIYSRAKSLIVSKYFKAWAEIIKKRARNEMAYVDLFSGTGRYDDNKVSTPLLIMEKILADKVLREKMKVIFNDESVENITKLKREVAKIAGINDLKNPTIFLNEDVAGIEKELHRIDGVPTFSFIDPFGYAGLTQDLIDRLTKGWGCDCVFFFNHDAIRRAISNKTVRKHVNSLFGEERADRLKEELGKFSQRNKRNACWKSCEKHLKSGLLT